MATSSRRGAEITSLRVPAGGLAFDVLAVGPEAGEPVVLLHGFPQTPDAWRGVMAELAAAGYRTLAPALRGYCAGARPSGTTAYRTGRMAEDVLAIATELGLGRIHLAGHDIGGAVAWRTATDHPERLLSLTAVSTPHPLAYVRALPGTQLLRSLYIPFFRLPALPELTLLSRGAAGLRTMLRASGLDAATARRYAAAMSEPGMLPAALAWYRAMGFSPRRAGTVASPAAGGSAPRVQVPTLHVWGAHDSALGRRATDGTAEYVDAPYRLVVLEDAGHWIPERCPRQLAELMLRHLHDTAEPARGA